MTTDGLMRPPERATHEVPGSGLVPNRRPEAARPTGGGGYNIDNIYWKKGPNENEPGYIIVGPGLETRQADRWRRGGRIPLKEYSYTDRISPRTGERYTIEYNRDGLQDSQGDTTWMYYWFFKNGGAPLFPVEQILEQKWHIFPPMGMSVDVFPQLQEYEIPEPFWCSLCTKDNPFLTEATLVKHGIVGHGLDRIEVLKLVKDAKRRPFNSPDLPLPVLVRKQVAEPTDTAAPEKGRQRASQEALVS